MDVDDRDDLQSTYRPEHSLVEARPRHGTALCLSGGGFRAALFHLGAVRRLNELGVLSGLDAISSVSGGSILSAHLLQRMRPRPAPGTAVDAATWEREVAEPFRRFTRQDLRTGPVARAWLLPWNWIRRDSAVRGLAAAYRRRLTGLRLTELPERPRFIFCATDMQFGVNWVFEKRGIGDYQAGWMTPVPPWRVADAVAASSC
ncbi:MAG TPA: patatin-like phospholipase family protein, partial [Herpetosiphonaceae bacterium]|nr:patatin-like phospholipase family protein [Herpetosiphonaceae bacterium]